MSWKRLSKNSSQTHGGCSAADIAVCSYSFLLWLTRLELPLYQHQFVGKTELKKCYQMILKDPKELRSWKNKKLQNTMGGEDHNFSWNQNKFLIGKAGRSMKLSILWRKHNILTKFPSHLVYICKFWQMKLMYTHLFCVYK